MRFVPLEMFRCGRVATAWRARLKTEGLQQLQSLTLEFYSKSELLGSSIGTAGCRALAKKLGELQKLESLELYLGNNSIGDAGCKALAEELGGMQRLGSLTLVLSNNRIIDWGCKEWPSLPVARRRLDGVRSQFNWPGEGRVSEIPAYMRAPPSLGCRFRGER